MDSNYDKLQRAFRRALVLSLLRSGPILPLVGIGAAGLLLFLVIWDRPLIGLVWSVLMAGLLTVAVVAALLSPDLRQRVLWQLLANRLGLTRSRGRLGPDARQIVDTFLKLMVAARLQGRRSATGRVERRALGNLYDLLSLHVETELSGCLSPAARHQAVADLTGLLFSARRLLVDNASPLMRVGRRPLVMELLRDTEALLAKALATRQATSGVSSNGPSPFSLLAEELDASLFSRRNNLRQDFERFSYEPCQSALDRLDAQYESLLAVLRRKREGDPHIVAEIPPLAEEAYRQGLSVLEDAFDLAQGLQAHNRERLERTADELEAEIAAISTEAEGRERSDFKRERLASHRERLRAISRQEMSIEELLNECERCEASLDTTRMELVSLKSDSTGVAVTAVTETLRQTVARARSVQDELKHLTA